MRLVVSAPAKINLFFDVAGKLDSGYHSLFTIMQSVSLSDKVTLEKSGGEGIFVSVSDPRLPAGEANSAYKAAAAFFKRTGIRPSIKIEIEKKIPVFAGLAGGGADAAAAIVGLDELYGTKLSDAELVEIGISAGSDVPFCIFGGTRLVQNSGDVLSRLKPLKSCFIALAKPDREVSTEAAYKTLDQTHIYGPDRVGALDACARGDFSDICKYAANVFEQAVEVVERVKIKETARSFGARLCQMSGSGPVVFALFEEKENAEACVDELKKFCPDVFLAVPTDKGASVIKTE